MEMSRPISREILGLTTFNSCYGASLMPGGVGISVQVIGSVPNRHREEFMELVNCSDNCGLESLRRLGIRRADHMSPLKWQEDPSSRSAEN